MIPYTALYNYAIRIDIVGGEFERFRTIITKIHEAIEDKLAESRDTTKPKKPLPGKPFNADSKTIRQ